MDRKQFQQRIVGAIVLVALGVIFIPIILNQGDEVSPITGTNIPAKPVELTRMTEQAPPSRPAAPDVNRDRPQFVDENTPAITQAEGLSPEVISDTKPKPVKPAAKVPSAQIETSKPAVKPVSDPSSKTQIASRKSNDKNGHKSRPRAWVVQVASFSERKKALDLRDRLKKAKHPTFVESVKAKDGLRYRVRVGPLVKRAKADRLKRKIVKQFKFKDALVMAHP